MYHPSCYTCYKPMDKRWMKKGLCRKVPFLSSLHCQCRGVSQFVKHTYLFMWYLLFKTQRGHMWSTKSPHLELIGERKVKRWDRLSYFSRDVPFLTLPHTNKGHDGHDTNLIGNKLYSRRILFCTVFLRDGNSKVYNNYIWLRRHDRCPFP